MTGLAVGYVMIGGQRFPITSVRLRGSQIELEIEMRGPRAAFSGPVTVFGEDGKGCWQGGIVEAPGIPSGVVWVLAYYLRQGHVQSSVPVVRLS